MPRKEQIAKIRMRPKFDPEPLLSEPIVTA
jgi:hypothetical protein